MARSADTTVWSNIASTATCKGLGDACDGEVWHAVDSLCAWWLSAFVELRFCDAGMSSPAGALVVCARGSARVARVHVSTQARTTVAAAILLAIATYLCNGAAGVVQRGGAGLPGCAFPPVHVGRAHATQALKYRAGWGEGSGDIRAYWQEGISLSFPSRFPSRFPGNEKENREGNRHWQEGNGEDQNNGRDSLGITCSSTAP